VGEGEPTRYSQLSLTRPRTRERDTPPCAGARGQSGSGRRDLYVRTSAVRGRGPAQVFGVTAPRPCRRPWS
jgi:hypothetical protein